VTPPTIAEVLNALIYGDNRKWVATQLDPDSMVIVTRDSLAEALRSLPDFISDVPLIHDAWAAAVIAAIEGGHHE